MEMRVVAPNVANSLRRLEIGIQRIARITRANRPQGLKHFWLRLTLRVVMAGPIPAISMRIARCFPCRVLRDIRAFAPVFAGHGRRRIAVPSQGIRRGNLYPSRTRPKELPVAP
jgi:hypothetical protein